MNLLKTSLINAIAVVLKILTMLGINKVLAIYVGPTGYALIGQLQNAVSMILTLSGNAINTGVTKYTAEFKDDEFAQQKVWDTAFRITFFTVAWLSLLIYLFSNQLALYFLKSSEYSYVFSTLAITLIFFSLNAQILAILNGKKEIINFVKINIIGSIFSFLLTATLAYFYGLKGALLALVTNQSLVFFVSYMLANKLAWFKKIKFLKYFDKSLAINLLKYALMGLVGAIVVPVSHIMVRSHIGITIGWAEAGLWDGLWRISTVYLMFITSVLSVYFLPKFSELKNKELLKKELTSGYLLILPFVMFISLLIYLFRQPIVFLLFSNEFLRMSDLFAWQLIGDVFKITSWLLGYILLAKAMTKLVIFSELIFATSFYLFTVYFTNLYGLVGVTYAYCLNYVLHLLFMLISLKKLKVL
jgi:PST family polysaccharide transporter